MYILIPSPPLVLSRIATGNAHNCAFGKQSSVDIKGRESLVCGSGLEIISPFSPITSKRSARAFMSSSSNSIFSSPSWHSLGGRLANGLVCRLAVWLVGRLAVGTDSKLSYVKDFNIKVPVLFGNTVAGRGCKNKQIIPS